MYLITFLKLFNFFTSYRDFNKSLIPVKYLIPYLLSI